ncbi:ATPase F0F1 [Paenibacillus sp. 1001270B_150601_E10]|uniref:ATPase F0F1 n=1 Tax=Paenibacillus sp. 1001270B_150601_E10 TaxID=2787079 RepID=UPI00189F4F2B|nr:ATPase F0F1 [Paenibacillus sp. 1001270B_150601_E10]
MKKKEANSSAWRMALAIGGAGFTLIGYIVVGFLLGKWLMHIYEGPRLWIGLGAIIGLLLGIVNIVWLVRKFLGEQHE